MPKTTSRRRSQIASPPRSSVVVHFGCGRLGTGAVLPFLIQQYGTTHTIIAVQRLSESWSRIPPGLISFGTDFGNLEVADTMPFQMRIIAPEGMNSAYLSVLLDSLVDENRIFLVVPGISSCHDLLRAIRKRAHELIISCSLGDDGQRELIRALKLSDCWDKALVFENTANKGWGSMAECHQVVVDRICWHVQPYSPKRGIISHCEKPDNASFYWPKSAKIPEMPGAGFRPRGESIAPLKSLAAILDVDFEHVQKRKRALINAPHAIAAVLSHYVLAKRGMEPGNQYLAPLQRMLETEYPQWYQAMDHYLRLRAIQLAWSPVAGKQDQESLHSRYLKNYATAKRAELRFFETNDRLDRLMSAGNFAKELSKLDEHIQRPLAFYDKNRKLLREKWVYGRPADADFEFLREFLYESFISASKWVMSNESR